ncbi:hypothetical protein JX265_009201 [Neoarthrinium moseri]|uniref:RRM domain-containing protein n=1 Tax=Neoarthrinium moseri TaxID=1658444 RepID=A0A9Q0AMW0_9PEZI|nr:uncharacterized protein JN550_006633 [Neoarthrinium moseri]KAI1847773.1 hypothetical protein JX266_006268 [Neoarthrinium moseri]KAI1862487.1 hypothetical protein JX265_009201 [Neoarthrinium moseri]KAI1868145.1 hypothetical protein JN550_006633 [Neoarthrinium moseri]
MAPKKKEQQQKMSLGAFLNDDNFGGSWADEVEDVIGSQPLPPAPHERRTGTFGFSSYGGGSGFGGDRDRGYPARDSFPTELPTRPPYTAHLGNLSYEATTETVTDFLADCDVTSVRIIEDKIEQRPKGFAYAEFADVEGLKRALELDGETFQGRNIRIRIADPPKGGDRGDRGDIARDLSSWERKGPLTGDPPRSDRRDFGERRGPPRDGPVDDGKVRDFGNWERRGPLSPIPQAERSGSRDSSRPEGRRNDSFRGGERPDRRTSPATWGEGRPEGSRPPREHSERPDRPDRPERAPTAAELDNQWRSNMKPDRATPDQSRNGSEAPPSPAGSAAAPVGRPRLNLQKRTVSEAPGVTSPPPASATDSKANPFGAARPIDTAAKEREIAEKKEQLAKEKKEADEKAKEERRLAKEAAAKEAAEAAAAAEAEAEAEKEKAKEEPASTPAESAENTEAQTGASDEQKIPTRPREQVQNPKARATESGNWRTASGEGRSARGGYQSAPRGGRGDSRGERGRGRGGASRFEGGRPPRANGGPPAAPGAQPASPAATPASPAAEESADPEGWTTVPSKGRRNPTTRA